MSIPPADYNDPRVQAAMKAVHEVVRACVKEGDSIVSIGCAAKNALGVFSCSSCGAMFLGEEAVIEGDKRIFPCCGVKRDLQ